MNVYLSLGQSGHPHSRQVWHMDEDWLSLGGPLPIIQVAARRIWP